MCNKNNSNYTLWSRPSERGSVCLHKLSFTKEMLERLASAQRVVESVDISHRLDPFDAKVALIDTYNFPTHYFKPFKG